MNIVPPPKRKGNLAYGLSVYTDAVCSPRMLKSKTSRRHLILSGYRALIARGVVSDSTTSSEYGIKVSDVHAVPVRSCDLDYLQEISLSTDADGCPTNFSKHVIIQFL